MPFCAMTMSVPVKVAPPAFCVSAMLTAPFTVVTVSLAAFCSATRTAGARFSPAIVFVGC